MPKKLVIPPYEQMIMDISHMTPDQLEIVIRCAKRMLQDLRPKGPRKPRTVKPAQEKTA